MRGGFCVVSPKRTDAEYLHDALVEHADSDVPGHFIDEEHLSLWLWVKMKPHIDPRSSPQRRRGLEPRRLKELRKMLRIVIDEHERYRFRSKIFGIRARSGRMRQTQKSAAELKAGSYKSAKGVKLHPFKSMNINGAITEDIEPWMKSVAHHYDRRWDQTNLNDIELFTRLGGLSPNNFVTYAREVREACLCIKRPWKLDERGMCCGAIEKAFRLYEPLVNLLSHALSSDDLWQAITPTGIVKRKTMRPVSPEETRGTIPQLSFLQIANRIVFAHLNPNLQEWCDRHHLGGCVCVGDGARRAHEGGEFSHVPGFRESQGPFFFWVFFR